MRSKILSARVFGNVGKGSTFEVREGHVLCPSADERTFNNSLKGEATDGAELLREFYLWTTQIS